MIFFQIDKLDKNQLLKRTYPNRYKGISILLFCIMVLFYVDFNTFQSRLTWSSTEIFFYCTYTLGYLAGFMESFLIIQLSNNIKIKFAMINIRLNATKPQNMRKIFPQQKTKIIEELQKEVNQVTADRMSEVVAAHYHLTMMSRKLNDTYGFPILILVIINFQAITSSFYVFLKMASFFSKFAEVSMMLKLSLAVIWPFIIFIEMLIIFKSFDDVAEKVFAKNAGYTVLCMREVSRQIVAQATFTICGTCRNTRIKNCEE